MPVPSTSSDDRHENEIGSLDEMKKVINEQRRFIDTMISSQDYADIGQGQHQGYHDSLDENNIRFPHGDADKKAHLFLTDINSLSTNALARNATLKVSK